MRSLGNAKDIAEDRVLRRRKKERAGSLDQVGLTALRFGSQTATNNHVALRHNHDQRDCGNLNITGKLRKGRLVYNPRAPSDTNCFLESKSQHHLHNHPG